MSHLAHNLDQPSNEVGAVDILVRFVEDDQLVEPTALVRGLGEHLKQNDEEPQRLVLLDEFVPEIDDDETPGTQDVRQSTGVVDVVLRELKA